MNKRPPKSPAKQCGGVAKPAEDGLVAISKSVELAINLQASVESLTKTGRRPIAPHRPGFDLAAWKVLAAYLVEERRLIEFVLGPVVYRETDNIWCYSYPDAICVDCFTPMSRRWRFRDQAARTKLWERADRINARLTHFSWTLGGIDARADSGTWNTHYLDDILGAMSQYVDHLGGFKPALVVSLRSSVETYHSRAP